MFSFFLSGKIMAICTICGLATEFLKQHMSVHTDKRIFECEICEKTLTIYQTYVNHKKCHLTWTCDNCDQIIPHNKILSLFFIYYDMVMWLVAQNANGKFGNRFARR